jgi:hypothetical protein
MTARDPRGRFAHGGIVGAINANARKHEGLLGALYPARPQKQGPVVGPANALDPHATDPELAQAIEARIAAERDLAALERKLDQQ